MKIKPSFGGRLQRRLYRRALTLLELCIVLVIGIAISAASLQLLSQSVVFHSLLEQQRFILEEAPAVGEMMSRIMKDCDRYRVYANNADATANTAGVTQGGKAVVLFMSSAGSANQELMMLNAADDGKGGTRLEVWHFNNGAWEDQAAWVAANGMKNIDFSIQDGVLVTTLTGKNDEQVSYAGSGNL